MPVPAGSSGLRTKVLRTCSHPNFSIFCPNWSTEICHRCPLDYILKQFIQVTYSSHAWSLWLWCSRKPGGIWVTYSPGEEGQTQFSSKKSESATPLCSAQGKPDAKPQFSGMKALQSWVPRCSVLQWLTRSCTALSHVPPAPNHGSSPGSQALMRVPRFSFSIGKYFILTKQRPYFLYLYTKEVTGICVSSVFIYTGFCLTRDNRNLNPCSHPTTAECLDFFFNCFGKYCACGSSLTQQDSRQLPVMKTVSSLTFSNLTFPAPNVINRADKDLPQ